MLDLSVNPSFVESGNGPVEGPTTYERTAAEQAAEQQAPSAVDTFVSALGQETLPAKAVDWAQEQFSSYIDPEWRVEPSMLTDYNEEYWPALSASVSQAHFDAIKANLDDELAYKEQLSHAGVTGMASVVAASMLDPTSYVMPLGTAYKWASTGSRLAQAVKTGVVTAAAATAHMEALRATSHTRTVEDTAHAALFAFGLGGGARFLFPHISSEVPTSIKAADDAVPAAQVAKNEAAVAMAADAQTASDPLEALRSKVAGTQRRATDIQANIQAAERRAIDIETLAMPQEPRLPADMKTLGAAIEASGADIKKASNIKTSASLAKAEKALARATEQRDALRSLGNGVEEALGTARRGVQEAKEAARTTLREAREALTEAKRAARDELALAKENVRNYKKQWKVTKLPEEHPLSTRLLRAEMDARFGKDHPLVKAVRDAEKGLKLGDDAPAMKAMRAATDNKAAYEASLKAADEATKKAAAGREAAAKVVSDAREAAIAQARANYKQAVANKAEAQRLMRSFPEQRKAWERDMLAYNAAVQEAKDSVAFARKTLGEAEWELGGLRAELNAAVANAERQSMDTLQANMVADALEAPRINTVGQDTARNLETQELDPAAFLDEAVARVGHDGGKTVLTNRALSSIGTRLVTNKAPEIRALGRLVSEIGRGGERIRENSAEMLKEVTERHMRSLFVPQYRDAFESWAKASGVSPLTRGFFGGGKAKFDRMVSEELAALEMGRKSPYSDVPQVKAVVKAVRNLNEVVVDYYKKSGMEMAETLTEGSPFYAPRRWQGVRMLAYNKDMGEDFSVSLIAKGLRLGPAKFEEKEAMAIAKAIFRRFTDRAVDATEDMSGMFSLDRKTELMRLLKETGMDDVDIESVAKRLYPKKEAGMAYTQSRVPLDLTAEMNGVRVLDLVDDNIEHTMMNYIRASSGWVALSKKGIRSPQEWKSLIDAAKRRIAARGVADEIEDAKVGFEHLEIVQKAIVGKPPFDETTATRLMRRVSDVTHVAALGGMGLTQFAEWGPAVGTAGIRSVLREIPGLRKMRADAITGKMDDELWGEMRKLGTVVGDDHLLSPPRLRDEENGLGVIAESRAAQVLDNALSRGKEVVGYLSAQYHMMSMQQKVWSRVLVQDLADRAKGKKGISDKRLADMGLDPARLDAITSAIKTHGKWEGDELKMLGASKWEPQVLEDLQVALQRSTNQMFQKTTFSELPRWTYYPAGKLVAQFRTYIIAAWEKQLERNARLAGFDIETASILGWSMGLGAASYMAKTYNQSLGRSDRQQFLQERLSEEAIAAGALAQLGILSILPDTVGYMAAMTTGVNPLSLTSSARTGVVRDAELGLNDLAASLGYINTALKSGAVVGKAARGEQVTTSDYNILRQLIPMQNGIGMAGFFNSATGR